jgi:hypothetical protein
MDFQLSILTAKSRSDKAIQTLKGILHGIILDGEVNELENLELNKWALEHKHLINKNPFNEFITIIAEATSGRIPPLEAVEDLYWLAQKYESDAHYYNALTSDLQVLQGICHGILADGVINDAEILALNQWLEQNEHLKRYYPYDEIRMVLEKVLQDGIIDNTERIMLKCFLSQFIDLKNQAIADNINSEVNHLPISGLCTNDPIVDFDSKSFCITGALKRCGRSVIHSEISQLNGIPVNSVSSKTDYLVVGDSGNQAWAFACYGRKVEEAVNLRKKGHPIMIIHEFDFCDILDEKIRC